MDNENYIREIESFDYDLSFLSGKSLMISGATGMVGKYLIDCIIHSSIDCGIIALGRNIEKAMERFPDYFNRKDFSFYTVDLDKPITVTEKADYIIHAASTTHPLAYSTDPIGTMTSNFNGLKNLLDYAYVSKTKRVAFISSVEIYGENRGDTDSFCEDYCGYINCNSLRAGYPEAKRACEALCNAYIEQKNMDIVIPRLCRVYGPTLQKTDTKAISQFIHKALKGENITLKSSGEQLYSYIYVKDAVTGILTCMEKGITGNAYNIADDRSAITLKRLAEIIAMTAGTEVIYEKPDVKELKGYSTATKAVLDTSKIINLGWKSDTDISSGLIQTINILKEK